MHETITRNPVVEILAEISPRIIGTIHPGLFSPSGEVIVPPLRAISIIYPQDNPSVWEYWEVAMEHPENKPGFDQRYCLDEFIPAINLDKTFDTYFGAERKKLDNPIINHNL
jgi:hypothetical protein